MFFTNAKKEIKEKKIQKNKKIHRRAVEDVGPYKSCFESYAKILLILCEKKERMMCFDFS